MVASSPSGSRIVCLISDSDYHRYNLRVFATQSGNTLEISTTGTFSPFKNSRNLKVFSQASTAVDLGMT